MAIVIYLIPVNAILGGLEQTAPYQYVHKHVEMVVIVQTQIRVPVQMNGKAMIVAHQYVHKHA
jgi:hypothetical protein